MWEKLGGGGGGRGMGRFWVGVGFIVWIGAVWGVWGGECEEGGGVWVKGRKG